MQKKRETEDKREKKNQFFFLQCITIEADIVNYVNKKLNSTFFFKFLNGY
jgi:hypothetical protein